MRPIKLTQEIDNEEIVKIIKKVNLFTYLYMTSVLLSVLLTSLKWLLS